MTIYLCIKCMASCDDPPMHRLKPALLLMVFCLFIPSAHAGPRKRKLWKVSAFILGSITIADIHSSAGRRELNPLLQSSDGRFGAHGMAVKGAIVGGALGAQWWMLKKNPGAAGYAAGANFAAAAATGAIAARNYMLQ